VGVVCLTNLATRHFLLGHISEAISLINQADSINQTIDRELQSKSNSILVAICRSQILIGIGNYKEAHTILESIIEIAVAREVGYNEDLHEHLLNSARLYLAFDIPEKALERLHWVEECLKKYFILEGIAMLKDAYAQVYLAQGEFAKAETSLNEAIALFQQMNSFRLGEADLTLAALRLAQNQPDAALQAAADAHKIFQEIAYYRLGEVILWEAKSHLALRHFPETRASLAAANAIFTRQQQPHTRQKRNL
jgi:tetratricopeptide (TPR) repeat protein